MEAKILGLKVLEWPDGVFPTGGPPIGMEASLVEKLADLKQVLTEDQYNEELARYFAAIYG